MILHFFLCTSKNIKKDNKTTARLILSYILYSYALRMILTSRYWITLLCIIMYIFTLTYTTQVQYHIIIVTFHDVMNGQ